MKQVLATRKPIKPTKKTSFHLQEDMQLLYELSQHGGINNKTFETIAS